MPDATADGYLGSYAVIKQALDTAPVEIEIQKEPDLMDLYQAMMK